MRSRDCGHGVGWESCGYGRRVGQHPKEQELGGGYSSWTGKARSRHLKDVVDEIAERVEEAGVVRLGWVKAHIGILGNEAADVLAKNAAEGI